MVMSFVRDPGQPENLKEPSFFQEVPHSVIAADSENHSRLRRVLANGFSAQSMIKQEYLIKGYIDLFFERMEEHHLSGKPVDVVKWYNYTTFDVIGDLAFGEPFDCLENSNYHTWVAMIFEQFKDAQMIGQLRRAYPALNVAIGPIVRFFAGKKIREQEELVEIKVDKRLALRSERPDFIDVMTAPGPDGKSKLSLKELQQNANLLIVAGSETTATTLCGVTSLLCTHPQVFAKLKEEVSSAFSTEAEITLLSVQKLKYMTAVIDEESFIPERWLGDPRFTNDKKDAFQPFSTGARNCVGKNLAYAEMRLILARLVWNYDISLANEADKDWTRNQQMWALWDKPPLNIRLERRKDQ
ncbi:putative trichothecene c-15 hydroxylase protein [Eutypa lata UCREL1]|uniref:Putative trichothecene c-15 hydroxylase protein n=1 Tax=Eutypa lata (strain UCR-EL1) TaxID=1287681 RepID=M7SEH5_EUTLA|nr:putative trichothecene c-15 hydroxylase protein [Eutypa lata UCREL1]